MVVDKEAGWTSHDVVARCRRIFGQRRVGHAGTLDPDATGVLLVGLGRATRLMRFLTALPKTYEAEVVLGYGHLHPRRLRGGHRDLGHGRGQPGRGAGGGGRRSPGPSSRCRPMVSAVKVGGRRLHALAREGIEVDRAARPVTVYRFDVSPGLTPGVFRIEVECSSGTYVRVLAADLGAALGRGCPPAEPPAHPDRLVLGGGRPAGRRADPGPGAHPGPGPPGPRPGGGARRCAEARWPAAWPSTGCPSGSPATVPGGWSTQSHRLLAVYEATETDRIRPAVVLEAAG